MAYSKQTWVRGEKVASTKLNHMEDGIDAISANGAIDTANLADGAVTLAKLADAVKSHFALADDVAAISEFIDDISETKYGKNRFNINGNITSGYYLGTNGELVQSATWNVSDYCFVKGFSNVYCWNNANGNSFTMWYVCAYKDDKTFLSYLGYGSSIAIPENAAYIRFCEQQFADSLMLESGTSKTTFEPYTETKTLLTDETLSNANLPANAKATGEAIYEATANLKSVLSFASVTLTMQNGKFLNGNTGAITDASGDSNKVSDYIEIDPNSAVMLTTEHFWSQGIYAFYDANRNYITGRAANSGGTVTQLHNEIISTPSNAKYIVIGYLYQASMPQPYLFTGVKSNAIKRWNGLKWSCIGDSLTAYNERTSMHYFDYIASATGISIYNMGVSGSGYAKLDDNFRTRVLSVPTDSDVVTIFGSGNDASAGLDLGTASDTGTTTLGGVINATLDNLFSIMPVCNVGIITPSPWQGNMPFDGGWMENYADLIVAICKRRSIPCLDLYHCSGLNPNSAEVRAAAYSKDDGGGVHPDEVGHKMIATKVQAFLDALLLH